MKLNLTQQIIDFIKKQRELNNVNASVFSKRIGKTNAYVSKLDKCDFKTIDITDLYYYIGCINTNNKTDEIIQTEDGIEIGTSIVNDFLDNYILTFNINEKESLKFYFEDEGLQTYDEVYRIISIPIELIDYINLRIENQNLTNEKILERCNSNQDLDEAVVKNNKYDYNIYYKLEDEESLAIKFYLDNNEFNKILLKEQDSCSFITIFMILYTINRLSAKPKISAKSASLFTYQTLDKFHFLSLKMKRDKNKVNSIKEREFKKLENLPIDVTYIISQFIGFFNSVALQDLNYMINKTDYIRENLHVDPSLLLSLMEVDLSPTKDMSIQKKRELLEDFENLIKKYADNNSENQIELL